jgi:hypothetical protein
VEEILLSSPADLLGAAGIRMELDLLLALGRADEVRGLLSEEELRANKHGLLYYEIPPPTSEKGAPIYAIPYHWPAYEWLHALQAAAVGDYSVARSELRTIRNGMRIAHDGLQQQLRNSDNSLLTLVPGLLAGPNPFLPAFTIHTLGLFLENWTALHNGEPTLRAQQADLFVLEALLALEQGDTVAARTAFIGAQEVTNTVPGPSVPYGGGPIASCYLAKMGADK